MAESDAVQLLQEAAQRIDQEIISVVAKIRASAEIEDYPGIEVFSAFMDKGALQTPFIVVDGEAATIEGWVLNNPLEYGTQSVGYARKVDAAGNVERQAIITNENGHKMDGICAAQSGNLVLGIDTGHDPISGPRDNSANQFALPWATPYPDGQGQVGKAGAFVAQSGGGGGVSGVTKAEVQEIVDNAVTEIKSHDDVDMHIVVDNIIQKVMLGLEREGVITLANIFDSAGLYQRVHDTVFEETTKVDRQRGIGHDAPESTPSQPITEDNQEPYVAPE